MSMWLRRIVAVGIAILTTVLLAMWTFVGSQWLYFHVWFSDLPLNVPLSQAGGPRPDAYGDAVQTCYLILLAGLSVKHERSLPGDFAGTALYRH